MVKLILQNFLNMLMKVVIEKVAVSWDEISAATIRKSWRKLIPLDDPVESSVSSPNNQPGTSECSPLSPDDGAGSQIVPVAAKRADQNYYI